jgi:hypothetical protein
MKNVVFFFFFCWSLHLIAQHRVSGSGYRGGRQAMKKQEWRMALGSTFFLGDVGGSDGVGLHYSLRDVNMRSTRYYGELGWRYAFAPRWATMVDAGVGQLYGNDRYSSNVIRNSRNIEVKTPIYTASVSAEFVLFKKSKKSWFQYLSKSSYSRTQWTVGVGAGFCAFDPKGYYNGAWYRLSPLNTEGQGTSIKDYRLITPIIPLRTCLRWGIGKSLSMGIELQYIITFTDYLDDTHGVYVPSGSLTDPLAVALANPAAENKSWFSAGQKRGGAANDAFFMSKIFLAKSIHTKRR